VNERKGPSRETINAVNKLIKSKHDEVITDKDELSRFRSFLRERAILLKEYAIVVPVEEGVYAWLHYKIDDLHKSGKQEVAVVTKRPVVYLCMDYPDRSVPEPCQNLPVWFLSETKRDE